MAYFSRTSAKITPENTGSSRLKSITDCSGTIWITDLQLQEGAVLSGYAPHTETMLGKYTEDGAEKSPV